MRDPVAPRSWMRRALTVAAVAVPLLFAAAALAAERWPARRFLLLYVAPFFVAFFAWARIRVDGPGRMPARTTAIDALAVVLGAVRFAGAPVPFSGHMLFAYSAPTTRSTPYRLLVLLLAAETTWFKLVLWSDFASWSLGLVLGAALAAAHLLVHRSTPLPSD